MVCCPVIAVCIVTADVMNSHWEDDEFKAFQEAVATHGWQYEYIGVSLVSKQAVVRIL